MIIPARPTDDETSEIDEFPAISEDEWMEILRDRFGKEWRIWRSDVGDWYGTHHVQLTKAETDMGLGRTMTATHPRELAALLDQQDQRRAG